MDDFLLGLNQKATALNWSQNQMEKCDYAWTHQD